jgi:hypothetical protein
MGAHRAPWPPAEIASRFVGLSMVEWLLMEVTIFGIPGQNWMLMVLAFSLVGTVFSFWLQR